MEQIYGKKANWEEIKKDSEKKYKELFGKNDEDPNATAWDAYLNKNDIVETPEELSEDLESVSTPTVEDTTNKPNNYTGIPVNQVTVSSTSGWQSDAS